MLPMIVHAERLRCSLSLVVATPRANAIYITPIIFPLRVDIRVAVDLARAGDQHARFTALREAANVQRSQHVCLDRLDRIAPEISSTGHSE